MVPCAHQHALGQHRLPSEYPAFSSPPFREHRVAATLQELPSLSSSGIKYFYGGVSRGSTWPDRGWSVLIWGLRRGERQRLVSCWSRATWKGQEVGAGCPQIHTSPRPHVPLCRSRLRGRGAERRHTSRRGSRGRLAARAAGSAQVHCTALGWAIYSSAESLLRQQPLESRGSLLLARPAGRRGASALPVPGRSGAAPQGAEPGHGGSRRSRPG